LWVIFRESFTKPKSNLLMAMPALCVGTSPKKKFKDWIVRGERFDLQFFAADAAAQSTK
jgi:hypothetical protein